MAFEAGDNPAATVIKIEKEFNQDLNESSFQVILLRVSVLYPHQHLSLSAIKGEHTRPQKATELRPSYIPLQPKGRL